ncbi:unnamed protein product [Cylindrotheca closterium]|uniref:Electron transfer flavoprotein alpha/beta-subunit N-terminal domain-containing protein n=1 Tax=Cylindrotheca closterium TaxID=2856 RepID=A0AAD2CCJ2_9STRA|nr:unnamed protein product [Cylindrotheca closterium]
MLDFHLGSVRALERQRQFRSNPSAVTAAQYFGQNIELLVVEGVSKVYHVPLEATLAESVALAIESVASVNDCSVVLGTSTKFSSTVIPRAAALLGVSPITDILEILDDNTFVRFKHADNVLEKVPIEDPTKRKVLSIRPTSFDKAPLTAVGEVAVTDVKPIIQRHMPAPQNAQNEDDSTADDGLATLRNDDDTNNKNYYEGNRKPIKRTDSKDDDTISTSSGRSSQETTDSIPPYDDKTLGDYITNEDEWFKDDITDKQKRLSTSLLIEGLKENEDFVKATQKYLKIDLARFLNDAPYQSKRVAGIDYDIKDSHMLYKYTNET